MRAAWLFTLVLLLVSIAWRPAHAHDAKRFALNWVREAGAESCISSHRLAALLQQAFGPVLVTADEAELAIEGHARAEPGSWHARIAVSDRQGRLLGVRELGVRADACSALDAQVLLVIAMAIDPEVALEGLPAELLAQLGAPSDAASALLEDLRAEQAARAPVSEPQAARAPMTEPKPAPAAPAAPAAIAKLEPPPMPLLSAFAQAGLTLGLGPEARPSLALALELHFAPRWALRGVGLWSAPVTRAIESPFLRSASVRFDASLAALAVCASPLLSRALRGSACAGAALFVRATTSRGLERAPDGSALTLAPVIDAVLSYIALAPLALSLSASLYVPLQKVRFAYAVAGAGAQQTLYESSSVAFAALLGAGVEL